MDEAKRLATEGARKAERRASLAWRRAAWRHLRARAMGGRPFTASNVTDLIGVPTHDTRAMGGLILRASRRGLIVATGEYRATDRIASHGRPERVWRGAVGVTWPAFDE
jgi:hypothetical protein